MMVVVVAAACGGESSTSSSSSGGVGADAAADGAPGPGDGGTDAPGPDDGGADAPADTGTDGAAASLEVELTVDTLRQDCMPIVAPDPVIMQGTLKITNKSASPVGPLTFASGKFFGAPPSAALATFATDTTTSTIAPGASTFVLVEKTTGSMSPKGGCQTLACNGSFVVELAFTGAGAPANATVRAAAETMSCTF